MTKKHIITVSLEDYYHVRSLSNVVDRRLWSRFESRLEQNALRALDLLDQHQAKATFFVLGCVAERQPEILREVVRRGHEIANKGYYPRNTREGMTDDLRDDLRRSRDCIEWTTGVGVMGCRIPQLLLTPSDLRPLDELAREGYLYDSSMVPLLRSFPKEKWRRFIHEHRVDDKLLWEAPISCCNIAGWNLPIGGGNYFRQFPHWMMKRWVEKWDRTVDAPFVMYFNIWELDRELPTFSSASRLTRVRQYRNLDKMSAILEDYLATFRFTGIASHLGLEAAVKENTSELRTEIQVAPEPAAQSLSRIPVSIVAPVFNEERTLPYLANTLKSVESALEDRYEVEFLFVDDGSTDQSWDCLVRLFGNAPNCSLIRHERNLGVAGAILTGIRAARSEIVATMDCDCTYDPHELKAMIPMLAPGVDLVTASPYSPGGRVLRVPAWRLGLSKSASWLYRRVLRQKLYTYTSCFRVIRKSAVSNLQVRNPGFLGVAEILGRMDLAGSRIIEYPTTLEVRLFGASKMKVVRTVAGHIHLLLLLAAIRLFGRPRSQGVSPTDLQVTRTPNGLM